MVQRSRVHTLPETIRDILNARLISNGFSDYIELASWLTEQGFEISKSSLQRYGSDLQASFDEAMGDVRRSIEMAKAVSESVRDDEGDLTDATVRIAQESLLRVTIALRQAEHDPTKGVAILAKVSHALADLGRLGISQKKWQAEQRKAVREEYAKEAAKAVGDELRGTHGMSEELEGRIRGILLGKA